MAKAKPLTGRGVAPGRPPAVDPVVGTGQPVDTVSPEELPAAQHWSCSALAGAGWTG